jgi:hypothetical protein
MQRGASKLVIMGTSHQKRKPWSSMKLEREALEALTPMLSKFGGRVNVQNPDCKIYVFDGWCWEWKKCWRGIWLPDEW